MKASNEGSAGHGGGVVLKEEKGYEEETAVIKVELNFFFFSWNILFYFILFCGLI